MGPSGVLFLGGWCPRTLLVPVVWVPPVALAVGPVLGPRWVVALLEVARHTVARHTVHPVIFVVSSIHGGTLLIE